MERGGKLIVSLLSVLALTMGTPAIRSSAASSDEPYRAIVDRNVFDLRPMPVNTGPATPPTPPPNVKLAGLMEITGHPQAVLSVTDPTAPSKPPVSYVLAEGEGKANVEVKSINMNTKTARVQIAGDIVQLKLEEVKAAAGGAPGLAAAPGQRQFPPGARGGGRGAFPMPTPGGPAVPAPGSNPASPSYQPGASSDTSGLPARPVRTDSVDPAQQAMTPEQSLVQMEQNRETYAQNNDPRAALLPPNPLYNALQQQQQQAAAGGGSTGSQQNTTQQQSPPAFGTRRTGTMAAPMPP